ASPLLRLPRRAGAIEAAIDASPPAFRRERRAGSRVLLEAGGDTVVDFGEELVGWLEVTASAPASLTVSAGESEEDGRDLPPRAANGPRQARLDAPGTWRDPGRSALRHVVVRNDGAAPVEIETQIDTVEIDASVRGTFRTSDPLLDRVYAVGRHTVLRCT